MTDVLVLSRRQGCLKMSPNMWGLATMNREPFALCFDNEDDGQQEREKHDAANHS